MALTSQTATFYYFIVLKRKEDVIQKLNFYTHPKCTSIKRNAQNTEEMDMTEEVCIYKYSLLLPVYCRIHVPPSIPHGCT